MALEQKSFWMPRDAGCLTNGEMSYSNSSRVESKRGHQWVLDPNGTELLSNKKQVIEAVNNGTISGLSNVNASPWDNNTSSFQPVPGQLTNRLFGSELESIPTDSIVDTNEIMGVGRKDFEDQFLKNPSVSLSMTHAVEDSSYLSFGGIRKVKVNEVRGDNSMITIGTNYKGTDDRFSSMGYSYNANSVEDCFIVTGQNYSKGDENNLSIDKGDGNFISTGQLFGKGPNNVMSMTPSCSKVHENFISMVPTSDEHFIPMGSCYSKENDYIISTGQAYDKVDLGIVPIGSTYDKEDSNTNSFEGFHETNPSDGIISSYDLLMSSQNSEEPDQKDLVESNVEPVIDNTKKSNSKADIAFKNKEPTTSKKLPPNNFPANVKSLLSTGMLDGVRVKYVSWSREKTLHGIIKGALYTCGCEDCQLSKALNAYEFERHAGCKTKHPNNHIYFENGKTVYAAVQELKSTPQEALFDAIQKVTGSSIHQNNFRLWKASFQAATLELQRIYGKDEIVMPC